MFASAAAEVLLGAAPATPTAVRAAVASRRRPPAAGSPKVSSHHTPVVSAPMRVLIAAGGTAGHVVPALAVADVLRADGVDVVFIGGERAETEAVPAAGYELHGRRVEGMTRRNPFKAARAAWRAAVATRRARRLLRELQPDAVMGGGGYVAGPVGLAAVRERIPLVLTEADSRLGLTNRLLAPCAKRFCRSFPIPERTGERFRVTGRPIFPPATDRRAARARFDLGPKDVCLLVTGGSQGARTVNEAA